MEDVWLWIEGKRYKGLGPRIKSVRVCKQVAGGERSIVVGKRFAKLPSDDGAAELDGDGPDGEVIADLIDRVVERPPECLCSRLIRRAPLVEEGNFAQKCVAIGTDG